MNENQAGPSNLLNTTDCLEAVGVFRGWKNVWFVIVALCLILLQVSFWLVDTSLVPAKALPCIEGGEEAKSQAPAVGSEAEQIKEAAKEATGANQPAEVEAKEPEGESPALAKQQETGALFDITFGHLAWLIRFVNAILVLAAVLYCLTLLFSLKVSLIGRLGGVNHISRAFFWSVVMVVLLLPWQEVFGCVVMGAIYTPCELASRCAAEKGNIFDIILYYMRFTGYWVVIVLLLILSHLRSARWTKAILRRLEVI